MSNKVPSLPPEVKAEIAVSFSEIHQKVDKHHKSTSAEMAGLQRSQAAMRADLDKRIDDVAGDVKSIHSKLDRLTEHIIDGEKTNRRQQESISDAQLTAVRAEAEVKNVARKAGGGIAAGLVGAVELVKLTIDWVQGK